VASRQKGLLLQALRAEDSLALSTPTTALSQFDILQGTKPAALGMMSGYSWEADPKRIAFSSARYLFVAKMLEGKAAVLEVGCADAFFSRIVRQHVGSLVACDLNPAYIDSARSLRSPKWMIVMRQLDILKETLTGFDAVYCLDLFEHIADEDLLLGNLSKCAPLAIIGTPSIESQQWASEISKSEHVNCKSKEALRAAMQKHWKEVLVFGMNDNVLHTGHMPAYLFGIGINASSP